MDRITYISNYGSDISAKDLEEIRTKSMENNARDGLTGVLMCFKGVFYQIIEGDRDQLKACFKRIQLDPRHTDIFVLNIEKDIEKRYYPRWKMKTVVLDRSTIPLARPIRYIFDSLAYTHKTLSKYAPTAILEGIQEGKEPLKWKMHQDQMVVMFSDLIGFSSIVEQASIEEVADFLNSYFEIALSTIQDSGGTISKLIGDGFLAYYPMKLAPKALVASIRIVSDLKHLRENSKSPFLKLTYCSVGLSAGKVVIGNVGTNAKMDYTVLGDVVNTASRLESYSREAGFSVLFDERLKNELPSDFSPSVMEISSFTPKGKSEELRVFTIDDPDVPFDIPPSEIRKRVWAIKSE